MTTDTGSAPAKRWMNISVNESSMCFYIESTTQDDSWWEQAVEVSFRRLSLHVETWPAYISARLNRRKWTRLPSRGAPLRVWNLQVTVCFQRQSQYGQRALTALRNRERKLALTAAGCTGFALAARSQRAEI